MAKWEYCRVMWMARRASESEVQELEKQGFEGKFEINDSQILALLGHLKFLKHSQEQKTITG